MRTLSQIHADRIAEILAREGRQVVDFPPIPEDLLKALEDRWPPRCLMGDESVDEHRHYAGAVELVTLLRIAYEAQHSEERLVAADHEADIIKGD